MATYEDIMDDAYGYSSKIEPGILATEHPELTGVIFRSLEALYSIAASINPTFFGAQATVANPGAGSPWPEPTSAETIFYIESGGDEVVVVRLQEQSDVDPGSPKVYSLGRELHTVGGTEDPDPATDDLEVYYADGPGTAPTAETDNLPPSWDEGHNELLVLQVVNYLATKDMGSMQDELTVFRQERNRELARYVRHLENHLANIRSRFGGRIPINTQSIVTHRQMLDGQLQAGG